MTSVEKKPEVPDILLLSALAPKEVGEKLVSPKLGSYIDKYSPAENPMWCRFSQAERDSLEEEFEARRLASFYMLLTAQKAQTSGNRALWVSRFNQASAESFSELDPKEALYIISQELTQLEAVDPDSYAANVYRFLLGRSKSEPRAGFEFEKLQLLREAVFSKLSPIVEVIAELEDKEYSSAEVREVFETIKSRLAEVDKGWDDWKITNTDGKTMMQVVPEDKEIDVPDGREPVSGKTELFGLAMHEIGVHATRAFNGYKTGDEMMAKGLPEYLGFEEGLATLLEFLCTDEIPEKIKSRYVDIALATGSIDGFRLSRKELIALGESREHMHLLAQGEEVDSSKITREVMAHVNRIFRGGDGNPIIGVDGEILDQAVFGKDAVYYEGFIKAYEYLASMIDSGMPMDKLLDYLLACKFDPTNQKHTSYISETHSLTI